MFRTIALAAVLGALALPAAAESVTINVAGLDAKTAHVKIVRAAQAACTAALRDQTTFDQFYEHVSCIDEAVANAEQTLKTTDQRVASR